MKKNTKISMPISTEHKEILKKRAEALGLSLASYCLQVLLKAKPIAEYEEEID